MNDKDYYDLMEFIQEGDLAALEEAAQVVKGFPQGRDNFTLSFWITNAVDLGTPSVVAWMLAKGVEINFLEADGYTVLHSAIERIATGKYEVLRQLIEAGADLNAHGINDWTPAHLAAARGDLKALQMLVEAGADLTVKTRIDDYATPLEEAKILNCSPEIIQYLMQHS